MWRSVLVVTDLVTPIGWVDPTHGNAPHVLEREKFLDERAALLTHVTVVEGQDALCVLEDQIRLELATNALAQGGRPNQHHVRQLPIEQRQLIWQMSLRS